MKHLVAILGLVFLLLASQKIVACSYYDFISLTLQHSRRIPHNFVSVEITDTEKGIEVHSVSKKRAESTAFDHTIELDSLFLFRQDHYESICHNLEQLDTTVLRKIEKEDGLDGTMCTLSFGFENERMTFTIWNPFYSLPQPGFLLFKLCCEQIIKAGGFKPEEVF